MLNCNKFWSQNFENLFCSSNLLPLKHMSFEEKLNSITRMILLVSAVGIVSGNVKSAVWFLTVSLILINIIYYSQNKMRTTTKKKQNVENYQYGCRTCAAKQTKTLPVTPQVEFIPYADKSCTTKQSPTGAVEFIPYASRDGFKMEGYNDPNYVSMSKQLAGVGTHRQTLIPPVVTAPSHDIDFWRANPTITNSHINESRSQDLYFSGYVATDCPGKTVISSADTSTSSTGVRENFEFPYLKENSSEYVNTSCGYNKNHADVNLPTNMSIGQCPKSIELSEHNRNMYTQYAGSDITTFSQVNEPISSNMGISYTQQIPPTTQKDVKYGVEFTEHDPFLMKETHEPVSRDETADVANMYDPRFYGYGTSYRAYTDDMTGQPRFMYNDVDAVKMPNYITRSKIDHLSFADTYGPKKCGEEFGNTNHANIRKMTQQAWIDNTTQFRTEMSQRLMRKKNAEMWQRKKFPIRTY